LSALRSLWEISLEYNNFETFPAVLLSLRALKMLWLDFNPWITKLPPDIGKEPHTYTHTHTTQTHALSDSGWLIAREQAR
jgi:Leucine-rich repeat (LRR) protein